MKTIANSQLMGKWYSIARTYNRLEMSFQEIFLYVSIGCGNYLDLLYVGIKEDRSKVLKKLDLEILPKEEACFIIIRKGLFWKKLKILTFDEKEKVLILSDMKMKHISILSRKPVLKHEIVEKCLNGIEALRGKEVKLYGNSIYETPQSDVSTW